MDQKKSKEYWKKRADRQEKKVHKEGDKLLKELDKNLINARKEIQKSINDLVVKYMDLTELSYADAIKNLTSSEFKEWRMTLEEYMAEIEKFKGIAEDIANKLKLELETLAMKSRISRLDTLKAQIDMELNRKAYAEQEALKGTLETVYNDSYRDIRLDFGVESSVAYLDKDTLSDLINYPWSGTDFSNRIWENRAALGRVLKEEIIQSFIQGISVKDLSDKIIGRINSDRKNTERLVRTEFNYALNQATKKGYEDSEVEEYEYLAEIDSRTSPQCRELNGKIFKLEDAKVGVNYPPMHPHCRSTTIPVIEYETLKESEKNGIMEEKDSILEGLDKKLTRKKFAEKLLSNLKLEHLNVSVKKLNARGSCGLNFEVLDSKSSKLTVKTYNLQKDDDRKKYYQLKTVFHEAYHALGHNKEVDFISVNYDFQNWAYIDDVFAECSAHYMMKRMGNKIPISPSYPKHLSETLPKLKKLEKFKKCKTLEDFGEIVWKDRMSGLNPNWITLRKELENIEIDKSYYDTYLEYARKNRSKIYTLIKRNSPSMPNEIIQNILDNALSKNKGEEQFFSLIIANTMKLKGVK